MDRKKKKAPAMRGMKKPRAAQKSLASPEPVARLVVHGVVSYPDTSRAASVTVVAFDQDETGKNRLGDFVTDAEGNYRIEYSAADYRLSKNEKGGADIFVRVYGSQGALLFHSDIVRSAPADLRIDATFPAVQFVVHGRVTAGKKGQLVRAYDVDLRGEELLGYDFTDADGDYEIPYSPRKFKRAETGTADLRVTVRLDDGSVRSSDVVYNAAADVIVNLEIEKAAPSPPVEYARYLTELAPALREVTLLEIDAETTVQKTKDLDFLAGDTGIDRQHVAWLVQAAGYEARTRIVDPTIRTHVSYSSIPAAAFYGWFRQNLSPELEALLSRSNGELIAELETSIAANIVPRDLATHFDSLAATLDRLRALRALQPAAEGAPASLGDTLSTLPDNEVLPDGEKLIFARLRNAHGDTDELWKQAEASGLSNAIPALKRTLALDRVTGSNPSLVRALQAKADVTRPESIEFLSALKPADWIDVVFEHGVPPGSAVDRDGYIDRLQADVENRFPTQVLSRRLEETLGENEHFPTSRVVSLLNANPNLNFKAQHIEPFLSEQGIEDESLRAASLQLARVHAITGSAKETAVLLAVGVGSSAQIVADGRAALMQKVGKTLSAERIDRIFAAAENAVSTTVAVGAAYAPSTAGSAVRVVATSNKVASTDVLNRYPSLRTLFGDLDYCECRHCRSVLGPAAYLADLLHFLHRSLLNSSDLAAANYDNPNPPVDVAVGGAALAVGGTVLGALLQRRPDLVDLELSCENTNTEIPYIDLVLEILENAVGLPLLVDPSEYAGVDIDGEFANGTVPQAVVDVLLQTDITVGTERTVERSSSLAFGSSFVIDNWIIKDGSRRWSVQHVNPQVVVSIAGPSGYGVAGKVLDATAAVAALSQRTLNAELEDILSRGLPIAGAPQIDEIPETISFLRLWSASYTRAIAIKSTPVSPRTSTVELFTLEGKSLGPPIEWSQRTVGDIFSEFTSGESKQINAKVAQRLGIPVDERYLQTWNEDKKWWELSVKNIALVAQGELLAVSALTYQNSAVGEDLTSTPENRNPAAYKKLASTNTVFPWALPFDLWLEETRAFLDAVGVSRSALIDLARPQSRSLEEASALELLGLSKSEAELILSASASTEPWIYWGLKEENNTVMDHTAGVRWNDDWQPILARISMLLQQSGLSYREYLDLRQTGFVGQPQGILFPPDECKTSDITLIGLDATQFTEHLNRVHRFTRLWRKSGWSMRDLDAALAAFGGRITPTALQDLALLKRLRVALESPLPALIGCISKLESKAWTDHAKEGTPIRPALYDSVFQRPSLRSLIDFDAFSLDNVDVATTTVTISGHVDFVAASLGVKPSQVQLWISGTPNLAISDLATLDNLSRVYGAASLCRALNIKPEALPGIVTLLGTVANPFRALPAPTTPDEVVEQVRTRARALLEFVERVRFVQSSGLEFDTLSYLLHHKILAGGAGDTGTQIEQQLTRTLTELRSSLQAGGVLGDVSAENLRRQLTRLDWYPALIDEVMGPEGLGFQPGAEAVINPPLAPAPVIPVNLRAKFSYQEIDTTKAVLKCAGSLAPADFASLANLFSAATIAALQTQYNAALSEHMKLLTDRMRVFELPQFTETLSNVTTAPVIPGDFSGRLRFAMTTATDGVLTLTGWLSDAEKKTLSDANTTNPTPAGIANLHTKALNYAPGPTVPKFITSTDAEQLLREPDTTARYRSILLRLVPRLDLDLLLAQLGTSLGVDPRVVDTLLDAATINGRSAKEQLTDAGLLRSYAKSPITRNDWKEQFNTLELLTKITTIGKTLVIQPEQWDYVLDTSFSILDVLALPTSAAMAASSFDSWRQLVNLFRLRDVLRDGPARLTRIDAALEAAAFNTVRQELADAFELSVSEVAGAVSTDLLAFKEGAPDKDYNNPDRLLELAQLLHVIASLGTTASNITQLIKPAPGETVALLARNLFAASVDSNVLAERLRPVSNRLRNLQRNALIAYLIHRDHLEDSNELFDRYLIDVEMGSCMLTSRIKQAISSVQLFVQRCLLNLERPVTPSEPGVSPAAIDTRRWQWMKFYRVWEANRKVFLYPENWIEPELRDDKTEIFQTFESDLLQSEITDETARAAFRKYLDGLTDISDLTVVSMVQEQTDDGRTLVHLVGRENCQPYKHYYRQWKLRPDADFGNWTAWEEISAQVDSEHVLIFLFGGSVYLAWPTISAGQVGNLKWKIRMNLAKRTTSGWTKLKKGRGEIESPMLPYQDERTSLAFRILYPPAAADGTVAIDTYGPVAQDAGETPNATEGPTIQVDNSDAGLKQVHGFNVRNAYLRLNLRALASYSYEYAGNLKQTHYRQTSDIALSVRVTADVARPRRFNYLGGYDEVKGNVYAVVVTNSSLGIVYSGAIDRFIPLSTITPNHWDAGNAKWVDDTPERETLLDVSKIEVEVTVNSPLNYKTPTVVRKFSVSKLDSFTWQEDFIFELNSDPHWLPSGSSTLETAGYFTLRDDDSLELFTRAAHMWSLHGRANTDNFMSGYREPGSSTGVLALGNASGPPSLNTTPGQYFIVPAQPAGSFTREIWAYRDDKFSLLFWRNVTDTKFRVVPFSTGGIAALKLNTAKGRMLDVVALPGSLVPKPVDVGAGIDFLRDPATGFDYASSHSVTQVKIDFEKVPSSIYNWEVFFHNPLLVATRLSQAQRFEEAQRWFHLIFDPTTNEPAPSPTTPENEAARYWRFLPLREAGKGQSIEALLEHLAKGATGLKDNIDEWADNPFRPHLVARHRLRSYQFAVVLKYLQNLIAWGDQIFRRDTIESINEATQLYVLAAKILGKRPVPSPKRQTSSKSYRDIQSQLDYFSNAWVALEPLIATEGTTQGFFQLQTNVNRLVGPSNDQLYSLGSLYFCVPGNEKLSEYWDTVEDRLFKIRHCMNIDGVERKLPLFEPPIDPALLVKATAAGLDISAVLADLEAPLPLYRFNVMLQKAMELCGEVRTLGSALLSALEKKDAEQLSLLRSTHEIQMLKLVRTIRERQKDEATTNLEALRKTREVTVQRYLNYQRLMGKRNVEVPAESSAATFGTSTLQLAPPSAGDADTESLALTAAEAGHMGWLRDANTLSLIAGSHSVLAGILHAIPDTQSGSSIPMAFQIKYGGSHLGSAVGAMGAAWNMAATNASFQATRNATIGGHQRRFDEWQFQSNMAAKELEQIDKQIIASDIRKQIAEREIANQNQLIDNATEADEFMRDKYTNQQLYSWMVGQISGVYFRTYQLAHTLSKKAERAYRFELGVKNSSFIEFGYWDSLKKGLMAGERLSLDLKRMEAAYLDQNKREYEITKHISLLQLDPAALITLRQTRQCEVTAPEAIFDLDFAGHYLRRIKHISLTIPCVTGPYAGVPCTLTLLKSSIRHSSAGGGDYARDMENDDTRFTDTFGSMQSIVTSSGQNDSGLFETNLRDDRYLPFEGAGAISTWHIELPNAFPAFDYDTIADVVLHIRYTARRDGGLKTAAESELQTAVNAVKSSTNESGASRLFSLKQEFPSEWHRLMQGNAPGDSSQEFVLAKNRFPFLLSQKAITISRVDLYAAPKAGATINAFPNVTIAPPQGTAALGTSTAMGQLQRVSTGPLAIVVDNAAANAKWTLGVPQAQLPALQQTISDILMVCHYTIG